MAMWLKNAIKNLNLLELEYVLIMGDLNIWEPLWPGFCCSFWRAFHFRAKIHVKNNASVTLWLTHKLMIQNSNNFSVSQIGFVACESRFITLAKLNSTSLRYHLILISAISSALQILFIHMWNKLCFVWSYTYN